MNTKSIIYFGLSLICIVIALVIFYVKFFNFMAFLLLVIGMAAVLLFRKGLAETKKKKE